MYRCHGITIKILGRTFDFHRYLIFTRSIFRQCVMLYFSWGGACWRWSANPRCSASISEIRFFSWQEKQRRREKLSVTFQRPSLVYLIFPSRGETRTFSVSILRAELPVYGAFHEDRFAEKNVRRDCSQPSECRPRLIFLDAIVLTEIAPRNISNRATK